MRNLIELWNTLVHGRAILRIECDRLMETNLALEKELAALRRDNRALVNAQLKQAGIVSLPELPEEAPPTINRVRRLSLHQAQLQYAFKTDPRRVEESKHGPRN